MLRQPDDPGLMPDEAGEDKYEFDALSWVILIAGAVAIVLMAAAWTLGFHFHPSEFPG